MTLVDRLTEKTVLWLSLTASFVFFSILALCSETTFDVGDGIRHYLISRYSWAHPNLLLDSWGKPFFTLVSSPFSQFGILGITFFNIFCGIASAYIVYRVAKKLNAPNALLTIPFLLFATIYFPTMNSGLTEPFFGLVLILSIFLILEKKYLLSALLVSFLPFVRSEGFFLLPLFFIVLIYLRSFRPALLLSFGTILYSIIGFFYFGDIFWIKTQNPYTGGTEHAYGHGEWYSFFVEWERIWGPTNGILLVLGILCIVLRMFSSKHRSDSRMFSSVINVETVLILGSFLLFFLAHTIMWWKGLANSLGMIRVFASVMPLSALICLRGFNLIMPEILLRNTVVKLVIICLLLFSIILTPLQSKYLPFRMSQEQRTVKDAGEWMKKEGHDKKMIFYLYPYLPLLLDLDAFDDKKSADLWSLYSQIKKHGISFIPNGTIVFWDAHFGPNECGIPLDSIMNDPNFDLLRSFHPRERFTTLGGHAFSVSIFEKRSAPKQPGRNFSKELQVVAFPAESVDETFNNETEFGKSLIKEVSELASETVRMVYHSVYEGEASAAEDALVVLSIDNAEGKNVFWDSKPFTFSTDSMGIKRVSASITVPLEAFYPTDVIKIYVWNKSRKDFILARKEIICWGK